MNRNEDRIGLLTALQGVDGPALLRLGPARRGPGVVVDVKPMHRSDQ